MVLADLVAGTFAGFAICVVGEVAPHPCHSTIASHVRKPHASIYR